MDLELAAPIYHHAVLTEHVRNGLAGWTQYRRIELPGIDGSGAFQYVER